MELLLYADDFLFNVSRKAEIEDVGVLIFILASLGVPFKWEKFRGGLTVDWIGYRVDLETRSLGISPRRAVWLIDWMLREAEADKTALKDFSAVLGRLAFSMGPLFFLRSFVAQLYA